MAQRSKFFLWLERSNGLPAVRLAPTRASGRSCAPGSRTDIHNPTLQQLERAQHNRIELRHS